MINFVSPFPPAQLLLSPSIQWFLPLLQCAFHLFLRELGCLEGVIISIGFSSIVVTPRQLCAASLHRDITTKLPKLALSMERALSGYAFITANLQDFPQQFQQRFQ